MADDPIEKLRRKLEPRPALPGMPATQAIPHKPSPPPTSPPRLGFGKLLVPPAKPERLPLARPLVGEKTRTDVSVPPPAPESAPMPPPAPSLPPKRSISPPPTERAVEPESVRIAQAQAKAGAAEQDLIEAEQRRKLKPSILDQLTGWIGTKQGKAALALAGTLAAGGGWSAAREAILAAVGIESSAAAQAREDRISKLIADVGVKATDNGIKVREVEKRTDEMKTRADKQANELIDLKSNAAMVVKPSN